MIACPVLPRPRVHSITIALLVPRGGVPGSIRGTELGRALGSGHAIEAAR
ncbi:hypothetical protein NY08_5109 [Rhodococcus sp. B7740]|nr:hypothetical protein NY08_5109 [Rhodococcus sp. B7740]